jgi:hypothetical protein
MPAVAQQPEFKKKETPGEKLARLRREIAENPTPEIVESPAAKDHKMKTFLAWFDLRVKAKRSA